MACRPKSTGWIGLWMALCALVVGGCETEPSSGSSSSACSGGCATGEMCLDYGNGAAACTSYCSSDSECPDNCCSQTASGKYVCMYSWYCDDGGTGSGGGQPSGGGDDECVYYPECVGQIEITRDEPCGDSRGIHYAIRNVCDTRLDFQVCTESCDGSWDCGMWYVDPGGEYTDFTCCTTERFDILAGPEDQFGMGCWPNPD